MALDLLAQRADRARADPARAVRLDESYGPKARIDLPGLGLVSAGLLGIVWGLVRGNESGWASPEIVGALVVGSARSSSRSCSGSCAPPQPMLPMRFFQNRTFALANVSSLFMFFGMFGSIFLLSQFFQTVQGYSPFQAGLRILPWTTMPIFVAPIAGAMSDRIGGHRLMGTGLALQAIGLAWIASVSSPTVGLRRSWSSRSSSAGSAWRSSSLPSPTSCSPRCGRRSRARRPGTNNAIRELGGVFGVAVLASVFTHAGGYGSPTSFVDGMAPAVYIGAAAVALGSIAAFAIPRKPRAAEREAAGETDLALAA